jgi:hypothetical protein
MQKIANKLLGIVVLGLLLSGNAYAKNITILFSDEKSIHLLTKVTLLSDKSFRRGNAAAINHCKTHKKYAFRKAIGMGKSDLEKHYKSKGYKIGKGFSKKPMLMHFICSQEIVKFLPSWAYDSGDNIDWSNYGDSSIASLIPKKEEKKIAEKSKRQDQSIEFNIKQKKEQCEAIGFEPKTEKFADCVLRLVELDVKSQQNNQIASAESTGNEALVEELRKQRNLQSSRYLLDLGKQLRQPKQYNSNIYMPQTQRCTITGFGTFAKMNCR